MGDKTAIEWTDATWNPIRGCSRVSEGCRNCYAERVAARFSGAGQPYEGLATMTTAGPRWTGTVALVKEHINDPLKWKKPRRIFVNSMSDLFHERVSDHWVDRVFAVMALCPQHTFQILTKRAERMAAYFKRIAESWEQTHQWFEAGKQFLSLGQLTSLEGRLAGPTWTTSLPNVWLGVSVEDQAAADGRIPHLLRTPAAVRFLSVEPLLGPVDLLYTTFNGADSFSKMAGIQWVIVGGESGPGARPMHPDWARSIRDQCANAGVPMFFKQWGEWAQCEKHGRATLFTRTGHIDPRFPHDVSTMIDGDVWMDHVGKARAGRTLDGREHNEFPSIPSEAHK